MHGPSGRRLSWFTACRRLRDGSAAHKDGPHAAAPVNVQGLNRPGGRPGCGRKRRITEDERSRIIALVKLTPPGRLKIQPSNELWAADVKGPEDWTLDALAATAQAEGIQVGIADPSDPHGRHAPASYPDLGHQP